VTDYLEQNVFYSVGLSDLLIIFVIAISGTYKPLIMLTTTIHVLNTLSYCSQRLKKSIHSYELALS